MIYSNSKPVALSLIASASLMALMTCPAQAAETSQKRDVASFSEIDQNGSVDVQVMVGKSQSVTVYADEEQIDQILTEVRHGELTIHQKSTRHGGFFKNRTSPRVVITVPKLSEFSSSGSGDASIKGVKGKDFGLSQNGSGDVTLAGSVKSASLRSQGSGDLDARSFNANDISLTSGGSGDVEFSGLNVSEFTYRGQGSGDLSVSGSCTTFTLNSMGSGDVDADKFKCKNVSVSSMGSASISIFASGDVEVDIMGSGDVDVYGNGHLTKSRTHGSGDVDIHR